MIDGTLSGYASVISGGNENKVLSAKSVISGGELNETNGAYSVISGGVGNVTKSYGEWLGGIYPTVPTTGNVTGFSAYDRIFNIGNGNGVSTRSNAFTILKNGLATLPSVTNALITADTTGKAVVTKEYLTLIVPTPPASGNYVLKAVNGTPQWILE